MFLSVTSILVHSHRASLFRLFFACLGIYLLEYLLSTSDVPRCVLVCSFIQLAVRGFICCVGLLSPVRSSLSCSLPL